METDKLQIQYANAPAPLLMASSASLFAGTLVYVLARPVVPAPVTELVTSLPIGALQAPLFLPFAHQLPSFFHMLAMLLASMAVTAHQPRLRSCALSVTVLLGLAMELVQHPAVLDSVGACTKTAFCRWLPGLEHYARSGTFDPLDLAAIVCALVATLLFFNQSSLLKISSR